MKFIFTNRCYIETYVRKLRCDKQTLYINAGTVAAVKSLIEEDRRLTVSDISTKVGVSYGSVHSILRNQLKMSKVHARWVPRLLKNAEKGRRVQDSLSFLRQDERHGDAFLDRIITTDETRDKAAVLCVEEKFIPTPTEGQGQPVRREVHVYQVYGQMGYAAVPFRA